MKNKFLSTLMGGAAFAMLTLNACTNETQEVAAESKPVGDSKEVMFIANNFVADGGVEARTLIEDGRFAWAEGDTIGILPDEGSQVYFKINNISETEANKAVFTGGAWGLKADNNYAAYYPFIQDIMLNREAVPVDYTAQTYSAREDGKVSLAHDYMAAMPVTREDGGLNFQFKHLGALVEVQFTLPEGESGAIKQLTLIADEAIFSLQGTFDLTADAVAITPAEGKEAYNVMVNVENLTAEAGKPVSVFFMMPPMTEVETDTWKAMVVYGENNTGLPLEISTEKTELKAGYYYTLETDAMKQAAAIVIGDYWYFSENINDALGALGGTKLRFVTGSPAVSETEVYSDDNEVKAYAMRNGDWLEVHTLAKSFKLSDYYVSSMFNASIFTNYSTLTSLDLSGFDTSSVTDMRQMFDSCSSLTSLDLSGFDTSLVENMNNMFYNCSSLTELDLSNFDTSSVTNMSYMFEGCSSLTSLDLSSFDTFSVTDMSGMFTRCFSLTSLDLSGFDTSLVENMNNMFHNCSSLTSLDLSNFDTSSVTDMRGMFDGCSSLNSLDLSNFDTSLVTDMHDMFYYCSSLTSLDLSSFDTSSVTDMAWMFGACSSLTSLDLSNFDTSSVTDMSGMFYNCSSLTELDLSGFDTSLVTDMSGMFNECSSLTSLDLSGFTFRSDGECNYEYMFCYVGANSCDWGAEEPKAVVYVKSQEDIDLLKELGLNDYLWLDYATLQVKPSQSAE